MGPIIVQKYGGSSVADPDRLRRVADRVAERVEAGQQLVVVVSAMGKATDELLALAREVAPRPDGRELDMLLTVGERITMALLAMAMRSRGHDAVSLTGSQSGILTTASHTNARVMEVRPFRVLDELARGRVVIVAGYQGVSYQREITTLGRGGSDTTAVALAAALDAEACEIYSDVDGVFSADPRVVPDAKPLAELDYASMQELSRAGAKVLNAQAVEFARAKGIAIYARLTGSDAPGSIIRRDIPAAPGRVVGVAGQRGLQVLRGGPELLSEVAEWRQRDAALVGALHTREGVTVIIGGVGGPWAAATAVASGTLDHAECWEVGARALIERGIELEATLLDAVRAVFVVAEPQLDDAVRALHAALVA